MKLLKIKLNVFKINKYQMKSKTLNNKSISEKLEECVKFFLNKQISKEIIILKK